MRTNASEYDWEAGLSQDCNEIEILCLPKNLPASIDIDIENIEAGQSVPIGELVLPEGVRIAALAKGGDVDKRRKSFYTERSLGRRYGRYCRK